MKKDELKAINPNIKWVQPVAPHSLLIRSIVVSDEKSSKNTKPFVMFDEIFPAKNSFKKTDKTRSYEQPNDTFHRAMIQVLTVGQFFGIMPLIGIRKPDASYLKFSWKTWRIAYTLLCVTASIYMTMTCILRMAFTGVDIFKTISVAFYGSTCMALILFLRLAPKWPALGASIENRERIHISQLRHNRRSLRSRFKIWTFAILFPALVEHMLSIVAGAAIAYDCAKEYSAFEMYFRNSFSPMFYFMDYSPYKGIMLQIINIEATFNWNFMDLFIIVMSLGLTERFDQLNERLESVKGKHLPELFWRSAREEYAHLSQLVKDVDAHINEIVLLSFTNNLYFICLQLFNSLNNANEDDSPDCRNASFRKLRGLTHSIYFAFSFGLLMARSIAVSLNAARIHSSSRGPAAALYEAPPASYGVEIQRFLEQVVSDMVALTGLNFFNVTRGLILTIAGTIVTYELVLVQFNTAPPPVQANITISNTCGTIPIKA